MPQDLVELESGEECGECNGGISDVAAVDCGYIDIASTTVNADRQVTLMVASTPGKVVELHFDDDETAKFDSTGERTNLVRRYQQALFGKAACMNLDKVLAADTLDRACCLIVAIRYNNGMEVVQGVDVIKDGVGWKATKSKTQAKSISSAFSDTGAAGADDRIEIKVDSVSRNLLVPFAVPATFGYDAFVSL